MYYTVPGMTLIPQQLRMDCWYSSARMLIHWRQEKSQMSIEGLVSPELDSRCQDILDEDKGMNYTKIIDMAESLGLKAIPPMTASPELIFKWLKRFGPLWVNEENHIVVIGGIRYLPIGGWQLQIYDPAPRFVGSIEWRSLNDWFESGGSKSTRDKTTWTQLRFMHCPKVIRAKAETTLYSHTKI